MSTYRRRDNLLCRPISSCVICMYISLQAPPQSLSRPCLGCYRLPTNVHGEESVLDGEGLLAATQPSVSLSSSIELSELLPRDGGLLPSDRGIKLVAGMTDVLYGFPSGATMPEHVAQRDMHTLYFHQSSFQCQRACCLQLGHEEGVTLAPTITGALESTIFATPAQIEDIPVRASHQNKQTSQFDNIPTFEIPDIPDIPYRIETKQIYVCTYQNCNREYGREPDLRRHYRGAHLRDETYKCRNPTCGRARRGFPRRDKRNDHERKVHGAMAFN
jgi:hypothetical protein